jgi:hypothetical protein
MRTTLTTRTPRQCAGFAYPEGLVRDERQRSNVLTHLIAATVLWSSLAVVASTVSFSRTPCPGYQAQPVPQSHQAVSKRPNSTSRPGAASNNARV